MPVDGAPDGLADENGPGHRELMQQIRRSHRLADGRVLGVPGAGDAGDDQRSNMNADAKIEPRLVGSCCESQPRDPPLKGQPRQNCAAPIVFVRDLGAEHRDQSVGVPLADDAFIPRDFVFGGVEDAIHHLVHRRRTVPLDDAGGVGHRAVHHGCVLSLIVANDG